MHTGVFGAERRVEDDFCRILMQVGVEDAGRPGEAQGVVGRLELELGEEVVLQVLKGRAAVISRPNVRSTGGGD